MIMHTLRTLIAFPFLLFALVVYSSHKRLLKFLSYLSTLFILRTQHESRLSAALIASAILHVQDVYLNKFYSLIF